MNCNDEDIRIISRKDFNCVANLAIHCDEKKLCVAINEAQIFDISKLLCDFWYDILDNLENQDYKILLCGGIYTDYNGRKKRLQGLKKVLVYYSYARYLLINEFNDTSSGSVTPINNFSLPKNIKEINLFADKYRSMAFELWKEVELYLCINKDKFMGFNSVNCPKCDCIDNSCDGNTKAKGYGMIATLINKKIR